MRKNKSIRNSLLIAIIIMAIIVSLFTFNYMRTKKKIENFNEVLGKNEELDFSQVMEALLNDKEPGTNEEKVRYAALSPDKGIIEIKEKMFIAQINDVYLNHKDYLGKTLKLEGIFITEQNNENSYRYVIRYGPGCCGFDANAGFEVRWANEKTNPYPAYNSWVEATGVLKTYEEDDNYYYLYLDLVSLNVLSKRGKETVLQ